jgi:hypothetical protein
MDDSRQNMNVVLWSDRFLTYMTSLLQSKMRLKCQYKWEDTNLESGVTGIFEGSITALAQGRATQLVACELNENQD